MNGCLERVRFEYLKKVMNICKGDCDKWFERCVNGGWCIDMIRDFECDCREIEYEGKRCVICKNMWK